MLSWQCLCLSNLIAESFWVFSKPVNIPQWILPPASRTQRVLFTSVSVYTLPRSPPGRVPSPQNVQQFYPFYAPFSPAQCPPGRALRILSDSSPLKNSQQSSSSTQPVRMLNAHLEEIYRIRSRILSATVFLLHSLASKVFNNLEVFLLS
jgi:hypothetical protein